MTPFPVTQFSPNIVNGSLENTFNISLNAPPALPIDGFRYDVANSEILLLVYYNLDQVIPKDSMNEVLAEASMTLRARMRYSHYVQLPSYHWTFVHQKWDCIIYVESSIPSSPHDQPKHLTYDLLLNTVRGLRGAVYSRDMFCGADFRIVDKESGLVGTGSIFPWNTNDPYKSDLN